MAHLSFETADHLWHTWAHTSNSEGPKYLNIVKRSSPGSLKRTISFKKRNGGFEGEKIDIISNSLMTIYNHFWLAALYSHAPTKQLNLNNVTNHINNTCTRIGSNNLTFLFSKTKIFFVSHSTKDLQRCS